MIVIHLCGYNRICPVAVHVSALTSIWYRPGADIWHDVLMFESYPMMFPFKYRKTSPSVSPSYTISMEPLSALYHASILTCTGTRCLPVGDSCFRLIYKIPELGVISRPAASTSCRSFFITSAGIHLLATLTVLTRLRLCTISIGANLLLSSAFLSLSLRS